jgi:hypothetical protein
MCKLLITIRYLKCGHSIDDTTDDPKCPGGPECPKNPPSLIGSTELGEKCPSCKEAAAKKKRKKR